MDGLYNDAERPNRCVYCYNLSIDIKQETPVFLFD
jgi:hypothetical protein